MNKNIFLIVGLGVFYQPLYSMDYIKSTGSLLQDNKAALVVSTLGIVSAIRTYRTYTDHKKSVPSVLKELNIITDSRAHYSYRQQGWEKMVHYKKREEITDYVENDAKDSNNNVESIEYNDHQKIRELLDKYVEIKDYILYIQKEPNNTPIKDLEDIEIGMTLEGQNLIITLNQFALSCLHGVNGLRGFYFYPLFIRAAARMNANLENENLVKQSLVVKKVLPTIDFVCAAGVTGYSGSSLWGAVAYGCSYIAGKAYYSSKTTRIDFEKIADQALSGERKDSDLRNLDLYKDLLEAFGKVNSRTNRDSLRNRIEWADKIVKETREKNAQELRARYSALISEQSS